MGEKRGKIRGNGAVSEKRQNRVHWLQHGVAKDSSSRAQPKKLKFTRAQKDVRFLLVPMLPPNTHKNDCNPTRQNYNQNIPKYPVGATTPSSPSYDLSAVEALELDAGAKAEAEARRERAAMNFMVGKRIF
jgi:hypothetical protein